MGNIISKVIERIRFHYNYRCVVNQWVIGVAKGNLSDIIRAKKFSPDIKWMRLKTAGHQQADPFILDVNSNGLELLIEDFRVDDGYAKIAHVSFDEHLHNTGHHILLDSGSHLSYPHIFRDDAGGSEFVIPEAGKSGKLSCYAYDPLNKKLDFVRDLIKLPLLDANVVRVENKYWIFGVTRPATGGDFFELRGYYADHLAGPYTPHPGNPLQAGLDGVRGAGNFFEVDGTWYRPTQNCEEEYGRSITINRINRLDETVFESEPYMTIEIDKTNGNNRNIHTLHTLNGEKGVIVVDGIRKKFAPFVRRKEIKNEKRS